MKNIYIILTYTGTVLSKIIRKVTKYEYTHVSISLDEELTQMYSFGRLNPYNPFIAGFVQEGIHFGTFNRFKNTKTKICSMQVDEIQYEKIKSIIESMSCSEIPYKYNIMGLVAARFNIQFKKCYSFYCTEFVKYVLDNANIDNNLPDVVKPEDFNALNLTLKYTGKLCDYGTHS